MSKPRRLNIFKTILIFAIFLCVVVGWGWVISRYFGNSIWFYFSLIVSLVMFTLAYFHSGSLVLALSDARILKKENAPALFEISRELALKGEIPEPRIYVIENEPALNAFSVGRNVRHSSIVVTRGLLNKLTPDEIEGVLAHEFSHLKSLDALLGSTAAVLIGFVALPYDLLLRSVLWKRLEDRERSGQVTKLLLFLTGAIFSIFALIATFMIRLIVSNDREFIADADGKSMSRPGGLKNALLKIAADQNSLRIAGSLTAHLWIDDPFKGGEGGIWFYGHLRAHPSIEERIRSLDVNNI